MARDGSGRYNRPVSPYVYDTDISEDDVNAEMTDIASELSNSVAADGQTTITANLPMSQRKHTGVGAGTARNEYGDVGSIQDGRYTWYGDAGGTANAVALTHGARQAPAFRPGKDSA